MNAKRQLTYCSFATHDKCLGVLILEGYLDSLQAAQLAAAKGLNPGGQVLASPCSETDTDVPPNVFEAMWNNRNKLLSGDQARQLFDALSIKELDELN